MHVTDMRQDKDIRQMTKQPKEKLFAIPVIGYFVHLIDAFFRLPRNDTRVKELRKNVKVLSSKGSVPDGKFDHHVPAILNALETVPALSHQISRTHQSANEKALVLDGKVIELDDKAEALDGKVIELSSEIASIRERLEFVRMELAYEMRQLLGGATTVSSNPEVAKKEIHNKEKVSGQLLDGGVKLNLGCGHIALDQYVNVDMRSLPGVDVIAELGDLPFSSGDVQEIFSAHVLEHVPQERLLRTLLPYWFSLLKEEGTFKAITPDAAAMITAAADGTYDYEDFRTVLFGAQEYDGDFHFNLLTPDSLKGHLEQAGFVNVELIEIGRRNGRCFEFEIHAEKPASV